MYRWFRAEIHVHTLAELLYHKTHTQSNPSFPSLLFLLFETEFHHVSLVGLKLSEIRLLLPLLRAEIKGVHHQIQPHQCLKVVLFCI